jgi:hypothetical protein
MLKELIIKVNNQDIHLSPKLTVPIEHTNIPIEHCKFHTHKDIFWKVELLEYNEDNKCWKMKVIDYLTNDIQNFDHQKSTRQVDRIAFEKFDWPKLEQHLSSYQTIKLLNVLDNHDTDRYFREETTQKRVPVIKTYKTDFSVYFSEAIFKLGYVTFSKNIKEIGNKLDFKIENDFILAEFDNIKTWFAKKLKTKKLKVNATINTTDGIITEILATSPQIAMIDAELIESIKYQRIVALTMAPKISNTDKSLFTAEEIFGEMKTDDIEGNVFKQNEQDILSFFLNHHKTRNKKQLEYLSGSKHSVNVKLRFTLHPNFGFLFLIEGNENNHFVWELLNSHSTYIWSIDKLEREIEIQYKRIEALINAIRDYGREQYKRAYRQNHLDCDLVFSAIEHDDITSNFIDGFVKWKHKLNEKIT